MSLKIFGDQKVLTEKDLKTVYDITLKYINKDTDSNLVFVASDEIKGLNKKYRGRGETTDVLAFPHEEEAFAGEVYINMSKVRENAKEYGVSAEDELKKMVVHGTLHLFGYDHIDEKDRKLMEEKEEDILSKIG